MGEGRFCGGRCSSKKERLGMIEKREEGFGLNREEVVVVGEEEESEVRSKRSREGARFRSQSKSVFFT